MNTLLILLALIGQPATLWTDLGTCSGVVSAPGVVVLTEGTCSLAGDGLLYIGSDPEEAVSLVGSPKRLSAGRIILRFAP